jgi:hypothetical protein
MDFLPVVFPGCSWHNLKPQDPLDKIPRLKGEFLWSQFGGAKKAGAAMIYVAMFDEVDEGTAIFKCTNNPPVGQSRFLTCEALPSDHYLWLTGEGGRMPRGERAIQDTVPGVRKRQGSSDVRVYGGTTRQDKYLIIASTLLRTWSLKPMRLT